MSQDLVYQHMAIPFYANMITDTLGMDSPQHCFDQKLYNQRLPVHYQFNSLGYRTHPVDKFNKNAILVLGDSFTLGLGSNANERYTDILEQQLSHQVLNFSLNGASNDWICRKLQQLLPLFEPRAVVIHYTFSHRRERPIPEWLDDERTECEPLYSSKQNYQNWYNNFQKISTLTGNTKLIHSFIPNWHDQPVDYLALGNTVVAPTKQLDVARDGFHYGPLTHLILAQQLTSLLVA